MKLFCFPFAGGSAMAYLRWSRMLHPDIKLCPIEYSGRGSRYRTRLIMSFDEMLEDLYQAVFAELDEEPYALFGHSMGAVLTFELARKIKQSAHRQPIHLFASGKRAPHMPPGNDIHDDLTDDQFREAIIKLGGTTNEVFENVELANIFVPVMRADIRVLNSYMYRKEEKLDCDITTLFGKEDPMTQDVGKEWSVHTNGSFRSHMIDGGHFFLLEHPQDIIKLINETLSSSELTMSFSSIFHGQK